MAPTLAAPPGDFDGDGDVDTADYLLFAQAWRQAHAPGGSAPSKYDLAGDGRLGHNSAAIFLGSWLTSELAAPTDPFDGAVAYSGALPAAGDVSYPTDGGTRVARAFRGQVIVHFKTAVSSATAQGLFATYGGTTRAQIPGLGIFLVGVPVGGESAFIGHMRADSRVYQAIPHLVGRRAGTEIVVVDDCGGTHGDKVEKVLTDRGVTVTQCRDDDSGGGDVVPISTLWEVEKAINDQKGGPILINISSYVGFVGDADFDDESPESQANVLSKYTEDRISLLKAIAALPAEYRQNLVITLAAGNDHMPLDDVFEKIAADPKLAEVLRDNVLFVGSKGQTFSNYSSSASSHFVWVSNSESEDGTSFAAPYALALISKIMTARGLSATDALLVAKAAANANASHELLESDVLPPLYKGTVSGETTDTVEGSVWKAVVSLNLSLAISGSGTVGNPYRVAMSFDGDIVETLLVCADPPCDAGGTYPVNGTGVQTSTGKVAGSATGMEGNLTVTLTDGTFNADRSKLTGTVTISSPFFDAPIAKTVTFNKGS
jgi:hypothetical protein